MLGVRAVEESSRPHCPRTLDGTFVEAAAPPRAAASFPMRRLERATAYRAALEPVGGLQV